MKLTEVSTNSQDIFSFPAPLGEVWRGGFALRSRSARSLLECGGGRLIGLLLLGDPALPSHTHTHYMPACVCVLNACVQAFADARNSECVRVCPSGLTKAHWGVRLGSV